MPLSQNKHRTAHFGDQNLSLESEEGTTYNVFKVFNGKPGPESDPDCLNLKCADLLDSGSK
jgi:hypothetical protein